MGIIKIGRLQNGKTDSLICLDWNKCVCSVSFYSICNIKEQKDFFQ